MTVIKIIILVLLSIYTIGCGVLLFSNLYYVLSKKYTKIKAKVSEYKTDGNDKYPIVLIERTKYIRSKNSVLKEVGIAEEIEAYYDGNAELRVQCLQYVKLFLTVLIISLILIGLVIMWIVK